MSKITASYFLNWSKKRQQTVLAACISATSEINAKDDLDCYTFWNIFNVKENYEYILSHKEYVIKTYNRFKTVFPNVSEIAIIKHDDSKISFIEMIGYTDKYIWNNDSHVFNIALNEHYKSNSHHPQYYCNVDENKCIKQDDMEIESLEESVIDMIARKWEKNVLMNKKTDSNELANINKLYLDRYTYDDRSRVISMLKLVANI